MVGDSAGKVILVCAGQVDSASDMAGRRSSNRRSACILAAALVSRV